MPTTRSPYLSDEQLAEDVRCFEAGAFTPAEFGHHRHMAVALWYLAHHPYDEALERMRTGLQRFLAHHGLAEGYNETLTVFWMRLLAHGLAAAPATAPLHERVEALIARWGSMAPVDAHWHRETVLSPAARTAWVEPDREPLPF